MLFTNSITHNSGSWYWFCALETSFKELVRWNKLIFPPPEWCSSQSVCACVYVCVCVCACARVHVKIKAHQAPLSMGFSRQDYWSGFHFLLQGILPIQGSILSLMSPVWAGGFFTTSTIWEAPTLKPHPITVFDLWTMWRLAEPTPGFSCKSKCNFTVGPPYLRFCIIGFNQPLLCVVLWCISSERNECLNGPTTFKRVLLMGQA